MNPPPSSQTPARVRWWWRWGRIVLLGLVAGIGALGWNQHTWQRAVRQLEAAGITADSHEHLGARLWTTSKDDWRELFKAGTWRTPPIMWYVAPDKAGQLRNLDAVAPALRRINPKLLVLVGCPALANVDGLKGLKALQNLNISDCPALQNVDGLKGLTALHVLGLSDCPALQNVDGIEGLTALREIGISGCAALQNVDGLKGLTALQWLSLSGYPALQNVDGLKGLTALQGLNLSGCAALQNVDGLKGLMALQRLNLTGCQKLPPEQVAALRAALPNADIQYP